MILLMVRSKVFSQLSNALLTHCVCGVILHLITNSMLTQKQDIVKADNLLQTQKEAICCPLFETEKWNNVQHAWNAKPFLVETVPEIFHIPLPGTYPKAIQRMWKRAHDAGVAPGPNDFLLLAHDPTAFKSELYMSVTGEVPGGRNEKFTGTFYSKVFEGRYSDIRRFIHQMQESLDAKKMIARKHYIYFPYCPKCARKYGHNYIVILSELE